MTPDMVVQLYERNRSLKRTAEETGLCVDTVRRILLDAGIAPSAQAARALDLYEQGLTVEQLADALGICVKRARASIPHTRCCYAAGPKTQNAEKIRKCRDRKRGKG